MAAFTIRPARADDVRRIAGIGYAAWRRGIGDLVPPEAGRRIGPETFAEFARDARGEILVADVDGRVVGFAATEHGDNQITDLWVSPDAEGQGIGTALMAATEARIGLRGYDAVEIDVMTANRRALGLYEYLGYRAIRESHAYDPHLQIELHKTRLRKRLSR